MTSYLNGKIAKGHRDLTHELKRLYIWGTSENILFPNRRIPFVRFINIINLFCSMQAYEESIDFIESYSKLVSKDLFEEVKKLGYSQLYLAQMEFDKVNLILRGVRFKEFAMENRAKWFLLVANYELNRDNIDLIESYVLSFQSYVRRNKVIVNIPTYKSLLNSGKYLLKLAKGNNEDLKEELRNEKYLLYRKWFDSKLK